MGQFPISPGRQNSIQLWITQQGGNRHVRWETIRRRSKGLAASTPKSRPWDDPRPPVSADMHKEIAWKNGCGCNGRLAGTPLWGQSPAWIGNPLAEWVEERPVECDTWTHWSWRPITVQDDQTGDERSYSVSFLVTPWVTLYHTLRKRKSWRIAWRLFQPETSLGPGIYWDGWRGAEFLLRDSWQ
jgi:hypothetical protein